MIQILGGLSRDADLVLTNCSTDSVSSVRLFLDANLDSLEQSFQQLCYMLALTSSSSRLHKVSYVSHRDSVCKVCAPSGPLLSV